jgi:hypothetical protein
MALEALAPLNHTPYRTIAAGPRSPLIPACRSSVLSSLIQPIGHRPLKAFHSAFQAGSLVICNCCINCTFRRASSCIVGGRGDHVRNSHYPLCQFAKLLVMTVEGFPRISPLIVPFLVHPMLPISWGCWCGLQSGVFRDLPVYSSVAFHPEH